MSWCPKRMRTIAAMLCELSRPTFKFSVQEFSMVGGYTESPEKPQTVEIGGWALVQVWVLAQDNMVCSRLQLKQPYD